MKKRHTKDAVRALSLLGCTDIEVLALGGDYHIAATESTGARLYLREVEELQAAVARLSAR